MNVFLRQIFGNALCELLRGLLPTVLALREEGRAEDVCVAVDNAEDQRVLALSRRKSRVSVHVPTRSRRSTLIVSKEEICLLRVETCALCAFLSRSAESTTEV